MSISFPRLRKVLGIIYSNKISAPFSLSSPLGHLVKLLSTVPTRVFCPWNFPGKSIGVGCHFLLQGISLTLGIEPRSPALQADTLPSEPSGEPSKLVCLRLSCKSLKLYFYSRPPLPHLFSFFFFFLLWLNKLFALVLLQVHRSFFCLIYSCVWTSLMYFSV